ncbi:MAG: zinc ribbon domain-containing protein [Clostridia bacterium]|nr:zinc ribbon domain-containing protein [Clostridia bacterium]
MALIKCADCGKEVSDRAKICPNCGCPIECSVSEASNETTVIQNPIEETPEQPKSSNGKKALIICGIVVAALLIAVAAVFASKYNKPEDPEVSVTDSFAEAESTDSESEVADTTTARADGNKSEAATTKKTNATVEKTTKKKVTYTEKTTKKNNSTTQKTTVKSPASNSGNDYSYSSVEYISDRTVDYDSTNKYHRVFFGLKDANLNYVSAKKGTATITIENTAGEVVYSKNVPFTSSDFTSWTNRYWDSSRYLACIYIKDSELTKGSSDEGTLTISVEADGATFTPTSMGVYDLPTKNLTINLPSTPKTFSDYGYSKELEAIVRVDEITYKSNVYDYNDVTVTFSFVTTMTYNSTPGVSKYVHIGYKLKNSKGIIVDSGTINVSQSDTGDTSLTEKLVFDLSMQETYTLELIDSTN